MTIACKKMNVVGLLLIIVFVVLASACVISPNNGDKLPDDGIVRFQGFTARPSLEVSIHLKNQDSNSWKKLASVNSTYSPTNIGGTNMYPYAVDVSVVGLDPESYSMETADGHRYDFKVLQDNKYKLITFDEGGLKCAGDKMVEGLNGFVAGFQCRSEDYPVLSLYSDNLPWIVECSPYGPPNDWFHTCSVPEDLTGTGYAVGDIMPNVTLKDQNSDKVELYQFYSKVLLVKVFTEWCSPCKASAPTVQELWEDHQDDGLVVLSVDHQAANFTPPTAGSIQNWVNTYDKTHPILADPIKIVPHDGGWPTYYVIDEDMTIKLIGGLTAAKVVILDLLNN